MSDAPSKSPSVPPPPVVPTQPQFSVARSPRWYESVLVVVLALFCFWPLGLVLVWVNHQWTTRAKVIITALIFVPILVFSFLLAGTFGMMANDPSLRDYGDSSTYGVSADCARAQRSQHANADFASAHLNGCNLAGLYLGGADLGGADLTGASLHGADLASAHLTGANLTGADMYGADLTGADLTGANLTGVDLTRADVSEADFTDAVWSNTTCPDRTNSSGHGATCIGYGI